MVLANFNVWQSGLIACLYLLPSLSERSKIILTYWLPVTARVEYTIFVFVVLKHHESKIKYQLPVIDLEHTQQDRITDDEQEMFKLSMNENWVPKKEPCRYKYSRVCYSLTVILKYLSSPR